MSERKPDSGGLPGYDFAYRLNSMWQKVLLAQGAIATGAWKQIKSGNYTFSDAMKGFAQTVEGYYSIFVEAWRGPGYVREPAWLFFDFNKGDPSTLEGPVTIPRPEVSVTNLDATDFVSMTTAGKSLKLYMDKPHWADDGHAKVGLTLDKEKVMKLANDQYVSFVLAKDRTGEPPLAIVLLRVRGP